MSGFIADFAPIVAWVLLGVGLGVIAMAVMNVSRHEEDDDAILRLRVLYHDALVENARLRNALDHPIDLPLPPGKSDW